MWRRSYVTHTQWCVLWDTLCILCWLCGTRSTVLTSTQHCIQVNSWLFIGPAYKSVVIIAEYVHPSIQENCCLRNLWEIFKLNAIFYYDSLLQCIKLLYDSHEVKKVWKTKGQPDSSSMMPFWRRWPSFIDNEIGNDRCSKAMFISLKSCFPRSWAL